MVLFCYRMGERNIIYYIWVVIADSLDESKLEVQILLIIKDTEIEKRSCKNELFML